MGKEVWKIKKSSFKDNSRIFSSVWVKGLNGVESSSFPNMPIDFVITKTFGIRNVKEL